MGFSKILASTNVWILVHAQKRLPFVIGGTAKKEFIIKITAPKGSTILGATVPFSVNMIWQVYVLYME